MFKLVVLAALGTLAQASVLRNHPGLDGRIVGGKDTTIENYPYQVSLELRGGHICGGSIISSKFVVTAAHCTSASTNSSLRIRAGSTIEGHGGVLINIKKIHQHELYNPQTTDYDISVLELEQDLVMSESIQPVGLPTQDQKIPTGSSAVCTGWGATSEDGWGATTLQTVTVNIVDREKCKKDYSRSNVTDRMICAGVPRGGKDACQGDSGGPLVVNGELVGIVSWGYGCARPEYPGVYSSVPNLRYHIKQTARI